MSLLFDRKVELHVFLASEKYIIKNLHMSFDILATRDSKPNTAQITVFNLSETTRSLFSKETTGIEFWAGYGDDIGMIFRGSWDKDVSIFRHRKEGTDWLTEIETGDGLKEFQNTYFDKSYSAGTPATTIVKDITKAMGLPVIFDWTNTKTLVSGAMFSGKAKDVLDDLATEYGFEWSSQHGSINVVDEGATMKSDPTAVVLSPDTGLVGRPVITKSGLEVTSLMLATIKPMRLIKLDPATVVTNLGGKQEEIKSGIKPSASGVYRVDRIRYHGNNFGGEFNCVIQSDLV